MTAQLLEQLAARDKLYSLPRDFYSGDAAYQMDLENIWYRSWVFAGHPFEIDEKKPLIFVLGEYQVTVVLEKGKLAAYASRDGEKKKIHCRVVTGYIFISLADVPDDFDVFAETIIPYTTPHNVADLKLATETNIIEYGNWKLVFENNRECYHCLSNHPELIITYPEDPAVTGIDVDGELPEIVDKHWKKCEASGLPSIFKIADDGTYRIARMPLLEDFTSYTMSGYDAVKKHVGNFKGVNPGALVLFHYRSLLTFGTEQTLKINNLLKKIKKGLIHQHMSRDLTQRLMKVGLSNLQSGIAIY